MYTQVYFKIKKRVNSFMEPPASHQKSLKGFSFHYLLFLKTNLLCTLKCLTYCYPFTFH